MTDGEDDLALVERFIEALRGEPIGSAYHPYIGEPEDADDDVTIDALVTVRQLAAAIRDAMAPVIADLEDQVDTAMGDDL